MPAAAQAPPATWDNVLRALVYDAHAKRGSSGYDDAINAIIDAYHMWPLIAYHEYRDRVAVEEAARKARIADAYRILQETSQLLDQQEVAA